MRRETLRWLLTETERKPTLLLDVIDELLRMPSSQPMGIAELRTVLSFSNSAYTVSSDSGLLEMRVTDGVAESVKRAIDAGSSSSSGSHLTAAWNAAYGRTPDPTKAYSEAIKAVEAAATPVLTPNDLKATLGRLCGQLKENKASWRFVIASQGEAGIDTVLSMMSILWNGQTSRHGGVVPTVNETPEQAKAAVLLSATLVQWFASGAIQRRNA